MSSPANKVACYRHQGHAYNSSTATTVFRILISRLLSIYCTHVCILMNESVVCVSRFKLYLNSIIELAYISDLSVIICWALNVTVNLLILYMNSILWGLWDKSPDPEYLIKHLYYWRLSIIPDNHENRQFQS